MLRFGVVIVGLLAALGGCVRSLPGQDPPAAARFYYPGRMAMAAERSTLLIVNTNFDQRFNVGWVTQVDMAHLLGQIASAAAAGSVLDMAGAATSLRQSVRIPSLAGDIVVDDEHQRAYVAHRGQGLIAVLEANAPTGQPLTLSCGQRDADDDLTHIERETDCARANLIDLQRDPGEGVRAKIDAAQTMLFADPAALALVPAAAGDYPILAVGYLGSSWLTLLSTGQNVADTAILRSRPIGQGALGRLLPVPDAAITPASGTLLGATHYADNQGDRGAVYSVDLRQMLAVGPDDPLGVDRFDFGLSIGTGQERADVSGAVFSPVDASRVYLAQANPDAVAILERSEVPASFVQADGTITYAPRLQTQVGPTAPMNDARPSQVVYVQRTGKSDLLAVSSLARDAIFFFEPSEGALKLAGRFALSRGQGPFDLMHVAADGKDYLFVTTFFDHGLTVLDISSVAYGDFRLAASLHDPLFPVASSLP